jgi:hypothetical protein
MEMPVARILSSNLPIVEREGRPQEIAAHCLQSAIENLKTCPERAKRVDWIETVVVPVVQRIERRFPNKPDPLFTLRFCRMLRYASL